MAGIGRFEFSHVGLYVFDIEAMVRFYKGAFGLLETDRGVVRGSSRIVFLSASERDHHQIVLVEGRTAPVDTALLNQISLRVADLTALRAAYAALCVRDDVSDITPTNHGNAFSIYARDPEGNRFEIFTDSPFYVEQAVIEPLDFSISDEELIASTKARHQHHASFRPIAEWRAQFRERLDRAAGVQEG